MTRPPYGLCLPCRWRRCRDGDTVEISLRGSDRVSAIRLIGVDAPERHTPEGRAARHFCESVLERASAGEEMAVWVPAPDDPLHLARSLLTFDRIVGEIWIGGRRLGDLLVASGHAVRSRP